MDPSTSSGQALQQLTIELTPGQQASAGVEQAQSSRRSAAPWLAWSMWTLSVVLSGVTFFLAYRNDPASFQAELLVGILDAVVLLLYATVGALVASRNPDHPIGWIFCVAAFLVACGGFA